MRLHRTIKRIQFCTIIAAFCTLYHLLHKGFEFFHVVTLADDDGVFFAQLVEVGKRRPEHRVSAHVGAAALFVKFLQSGLHGGYVADEAHF